MDNSGRETGISVIHLKKICECITAKAALMETWPFDTEIFLSTWMAVAQ